MADETVNHPSPMENPPLIVGFVSDLFFISKIESAAARINFQIEWIEGEEQIALPDPNAPVRQLGEHLVGPGAILLEKITNLQPVLILFDLSNSSLPWREWLPMIKSVPATRRIPVMCFGSHVDADTLKYAKSAGADVVMARSAFAKDLPALLQQTARIPDYLSIRTFCQGSLPPLAIKGLEEFNRREYFQSHETLEEVWKHDQSVGREFYRAILQVAVAYLQIERGNYRGAMKMFLRLHQWIDPLPNTCRGVDIAQLRADAYHVYQVLTGLGMQRMHEFDQSLLKQVHFVA